MKYLFIDANIWLSLYAFANDDIEQFNKLSELLDNEIKLLIPRQVYDEVMRNRDNKLRDMLKQFEINVAKFPAFSKAYPEYEGFKTKYDEIRQNFDGWKRKIRDDIEKGILPADKTIELFMKEDKLSDCDSVVANAHRRVLKGNPPGKSGDGDAINWECLLRNVPDNTDVYIVSDDQDYYSPLDDKKINGFLAKEWMAKKHAKVHLYRNLVAFLKEHTTTIQLYNEERKTQLIEGLCNSGSFKATHDYIEELSEFTDWNVEEIIKLCKAGAKNNQIRWIIYDEDIERFYEDILKLCPRELIDDINVAEVRNMLQNKQDTNNVDVSESWDF